MSQKKTGGKISLWKRFFLQSYSSAIVAIIWEYPKVCVNLQTDVCIILTVYRNFTLETTYVFVHILSPLNCGLICFILQTQSLLFIPVNL